MADWKNILEDTPLITQYLTGLEGGGEHLAGLLKLAKYLKTHPEVFDSKPLAGKILTSLFLSPSMRTRTSFEVAMYRLGGHMVTLTPGAGSWGLAFDDQPMTEGPAEHIIEAAGALSGYSDAIAMRAFAPMEDFEAEMLDLPIQALGKYARVPVISLESAAYHPCQGLADALTLDELCAGKTQGVPFVLSWTPHPKCCGTPVPHSALLAAARMGMDVRLAHPPGYELHEAIVDKAHQLSRDNGGSITLTNDQDAALNGAHIVYAKAWGSRHDYGQRELASARNAQHSDWTISAKKMALGTDTRLMHCLPLRRGVVVDGDVLDSPASAVQQQAENRLWGQMALLLSMLGRTP